jgi:hypothetical protein
VFLEFLQRLIAKRERKLFWIIDRHLVHQAKVVQQWLAAHADQIEVFELPSYSPQWKMRSLSISKASISNGSWAIDKGKGNPSVT